MFSNKPYLIRAFYEWIVDNGCTPFVIINTEYPRCNVPQEFIVDGEITLNVSPDAVRDLKISNEILEFRASFSGIVHIISAPIKAVLAVYAEENEQGMYFDYEEEDTTDTWKTNVPSPATTEGLPDIQNKKNASHLRLVE